MKIARLLGVLLTVLLTVFKLSAQQDSVMKFSLTEAQNYAIENFYVSKNAKLDIKSAKWRVWETTALGFPQVTASASYQHIPGEIPELDFGMDSLYSYLFGSLIDLGYPPPSSLTESSGSSSAISTKNTFNYGITVSQLLFSGEYIVGLQAARVYKSISEESNVKTEIELRQSVADSYFSILILENNRMVLEKTLDNLKTNLYQMQKSYEVGLIEDTEVDQIDLMVKRTENSLVSIERQIEFLASMFKYQIGLNPDVQIELTGTIDRLIVENIVNDAAYDFVPEDNIDYQMLMTQEQLMKLLMRREESKYLPTVAGFYQYQDKTQRTDFDFTIKHIIGVSIDLPLVTSGSRMALVSQARIEYEKAQNTRLQETNRLFMAARQATFDYRTALEKYNNEKFNFELSEKVYNKTFEKHKEGVVSSLELSLINNQFLQAQISYSTAVQELLSAKVAMDKAYNKL